MSYVKILTNTSIAASDSIHNNIADITQNLIVIEKAISDNADLAESSWSGEAKNKYVEVNEMLLGFYTKLNDYFLILEAQLTNVATEAKNYDDTLLSELNGM